MEVERSCPVCRSHMSRSPRMELTYVVSTHACARARSHACPCSCVCVCVHVCPCVSVDLSPSDCATCKGTASVSTRVAGSTIPC